MDKGEYITPRDDNDINASYTMAGAVFSACFLNTLLRNADIVGMANFAPAVNTRGAIFTHEKGIVLRTTYHVFHMYENLMGDEVIDAHITDVPVLHTVDGLQGRQDVPMVDAVATRCSGSGDVALALVNKSPDAFCPVSLRMQGTRQDRDDHPHGGLYRRLQRHRP